MVLVGASMATRGRVRLLSRATVLASGARLCIDGTSSSGPITLRSDCMLYRSCLTVCRLLIAISFWQ